MFLLKRLMILGVLTVAVVMSGCGGNQARTPSGLWDSPQHHFNNGLKSLDAGDTVAAGVQFDLALQIDDEYPPALAGQGYIAALSGKADEAEDLLDDAYDEIDGDMPIIVQLWPYIMNIRSQAAFYAADIIDRDEFIENVDDIFEDASEIDSRNAALYFYTGEAYVDALELGAAEVMFARVLEMNNGYVERARERWQIVQQANRVAPGTIVGREIVLQRTISRADLAALLVEELDISRFASRTQPDAVPAFATPDEERVKIALDTASAVSDIAEHPLRSDIESVLRYGIKGMDLYPDRSFRPDETVTRAEAAMVFEDIIVRATGQKELATRFIGQQSKFPDVRGDHPAFNAIMLCTTRGVMDADLRTGTFRPLGRISGLEALAAIQELRQNLAVF